MIKAIVYNYETHDKETYFFEELSELTDYLLNNNIELILKEDI